MNLECDPQVLFAGGLRTFEDFPLGFKIPLFLLLHSSFFSASFCQSLEVGCPVLCFAWETQRGYCDSCPSAAEQQPASCLASLNRYGCRFVHVSAGRSSNSTWAQGAAFRRCMVLCSADDASKVACIPFSSVPWGLLGWYRMAHQSKQEWVLQREPSMRDPRLRCCLPVCQKNAMPLLLLLIIQTKFIVHVRPHLCKYGAAAWYYMIATSLDSNLTLYGL